MGSGQAGPDERASEGSEISFGRRVLEATDILCQWYLSPPKKLKMFSISIDLDYITRHQLFSIIAEY